MKENISIINRDHKYRVFVQDMVSKKIVVVNKPVDAVLSISSPYQASLDIIALYDYDRNYYLRTLYGLNKLVKSLNKQLTKSDLLKMEQIARDIRRHSDFSDTDSQVK